MNTISDEEIKNKGMEYIDNLLKEGVVHISHENKPKYVVITEENYCKLSKKAFLTDTLLSEKEYKQGNFKRGNSLELFKDLEI